MSGSMTTLWLVVRWIVFRPDITEMVAWASKNIDLPAYVSKQRVGRWRTASGWKGGYVGCRENWGFAQGSWKEVWTWEVKCGKCQTKTAKRLELSKCLWPVLTWINCAWPLFNRAVLYCSYIENVIQETYPWITFLAIWGKQTSLQDCNLVGTFLTWFLIFNCVF